ncbi:unnamed protein product [Camellia sinensis]
MRLVKPKSFFIFIFIFIFIISCCMYIHAFMEREGMVDGQTSIPLLNRENPDHGASSSSSSSATPVLLFSTFVAVCGSYVFGSAVGFSSPTQSEIMEDLGLSLAEYSVFGSIMTVGAMLGAVMSGKLADLFGRRGTLGFSDIFCIIGWLAMALSERAWCLDLGRLSLGYGIGLLSYVVPVYIAEITPRDIRGTFTTAHQFLDSCGVSIMYLIGTIITWRILAAIGIIPCLIQFVGLFFIPESPRWLAKNYRWSDCEAALQRLRGESANISEEATEIRVYTENLQQFSEAKIFDLFQRKYAHSLIVGVGLMALQQFGGINGIVYYASAIFESAGFSSRIGTIAMVVVQVPATLIGALLMDKSGRRLLLVISAGGTCLGCFLVGLSFLLQDLELWKELTPSLALVGVLVFKGSFSLGMAGIPWIIMSEIFPINVKGLAGSLITVVNWLGTWIVTYAFNFLMNCSSEGTFFAFSGVCGLTVWFVVKLVPETKGLTLEEIQTAMYPSTTKI